MYLNIFNQDFLENFFSRMKSRGGNRDNPTPMEFNSDYRTISVDSLFVQIKGSNCKLDAGNLLIKLNSYTVNTSHATPTIRSSLAVLSEPELQTTSIIDSNSLHLLCSDIIKLIYTKFECKDCLQLLTKSASNVFSAGSVRVMLDKNSSDYFPSTLFYDFINNLLTCFRNNIMSILYKNEIYVNFVNIISDNNFVFKYCAICIVNDFVLSIFFLNQMKFLLRKENTEFTVDSKSTGK